MNVESQSVLILSGGIYIVQKFSKLSNIPSMTMEFFVIDIFRRNILRLFHFIWWCFFKYKNYKKN